MRLLAVIICCVGIITAPALMSRPVHPPGVQAAMEYYKTQSVAFARRTTRLREAVETHQSAAIIQSRLLDCRISYKHIESFLEYFFRSSSTIYNRPPKYEADDPDMEYQSPIGFQLIEALVYDSLPDYRALLDQTKAVENAASDLPALLYGFDGSDAQLLESMRVELIRIMALDITGYEAPLLKSGIVESRAALQSIADELQPLLTSTPRSDSLRQVLADAIRKTEGPFDSFDRIRFYKEELMPLQHQLGKFITENGLLLNTTKLLNYEADNLFSPDAIHTVGPESKAEAIALGRRLFFDPTLSENGSKSCASCHDATKGFTDQLPQSIAYDGQHHVDRNAPTLLYSGYQFTQFWDGRVRSLEEQIHTVLFDKREMHSDSSILNRRGGVDSVARAIAAYVRSLHPRNSAFDQYMQGKGRSLTRDELSGANLFLGKAQCATCHFIPLFNGLIPPDYALTEFEVLGTTQTDDFLHPVQSKDSGRYKIYPFDFMAGAFKTPTVRNAALTAPYMHNGALSNLQKLMEFYNKGGGQGLGLKVPEQTLSPTALQLTQKEMDDIILFMHTLTDSVKRNS